MKSFNGLVFDWLQLDHQQLTCCEDMLSYNLLLRHVDTFKIIWQIVNVPKQLHQDSDIAR